MIKHRLATGLIYFYMNKKGFRGWTSFWNTIYYVDCASMNDMKLRRHELKHIEQIEKEGRFRFAFKYLYYNIKLGYKNNPYEIEARNAELI